jgi:epoxyqueuosine reductase
MMMAGSSEQVLSQLRQSGFQAKTVSVSHLPEVQDSIDSLVLKGLIDESLTRTFLGHFHYDPSAALPAASTIFIVSMPLPVTRLTFHWQGKTFSGNLAPGYFSKAEDIRRRDTLSQALETAGYKMATAELPLKTLAVRSGLAQYGKTNVTYVPGFGSFQRLSAYYSDCPCEVDNWQESRSLKACENCQVCQSACPAGSIQGDRFLIHAEKCRTWSSADEKVVQAWIREHWHNMLVGCLICQQACPANKERVADIVAGPDLAEDETALIIRGTPLEKLPEVVRRKLAGITNETVFNMFARNLKCFLIVRNSGSRAEQNHLS